MKKILLIISAVLLVTGVVAIPWGLAVSYRVAYDVNTGTPYYQAIQYVRDQKIATGYYDGTFRPYDNASRSEFVAMVVKTKGANPSTATYRYCYADVGSEWYANEVCYAKSMGWIPTTYYSGNNYGYFYPTSAITMTDARSIMNSAFGTSTYYDGNTSYVTRGLAAQMMYSVRGYTGTSSYYPVQQTVYNDPYYYNNTYNSTYNNQPAYCTSTYCNNTYYTPLPPPSAAPVAGNNYYYTDPYYYDGTYNTVVNNVVDPFYNNDPYYRYPTSTRDYYRVTDDYNYTNPYDDNRYDNRSYRDGNYRVIDGRNTYVPDGYPQPWY